MDPLEKFDFVNTHKLERTGIESALPKMATCLDWKDSTITAGELMEKDYLQLWTGNEGLWSFYLWKQAGTSQVNEIARNFDTIAKYIPQDSVTRAHIDSMNHDLTRVVIENSFDTTGQEFPLFIIENTGILPFRCGSIFDGNHRILAILKSLREGRIQESTPIPVCTSKIPNWFILGYNLMAFNSARMTEEDKRKLFRQQMQDRGFPFDISFVAPLCGAVKDKVKKLTTVLQRQ